MHPRYTEPAGISQEAEKPTAESAPAPDAAKRPPFRRLRAFAFDPLLSTQLDTLALNDITLPVPWEDDLEPGPVGEYLEVIDVDPPGRCFYAPVHLNAPHLLATDGLAPSEGNPQFHQQMVYAVAMTTIRHFEQALGRWAMWAPHHGRFVQRLRIYPHALREANAYYSPVKVALLFGYFSASESAPGRNLPGGTVFTCLSHDIIAHEMAHALLDGMHGRFVEPSNPDALAFHEAFADIVALLQHFSFPSVLRDQIARTRGDLTRQNLLGQLAQQFGEAVGRYGALRDALGDVAPDTGQWTPRTPDPAALAQTAEPHARGSILVAAVFDAFLAIYKSRVADLLRIHTGGSGILSPGELHPDLVNRLAQAASKSARHVLGMCIAALDYCPPVDITFGEYLRALVTADADMVQDDDLGYRVAMVDAFRRRGIYPDRVRSLAPDSLVWSETVEPRERPVRERLRPVTDAVTNMFNQWNLLPDRRSAFDFSREARQSLRCWLLALCDAVGVEHVQEVTGLALADDAPASVRRGDDGLPDFEVHDVRPAQRVGPDGQLAQILTVELTQDRAGFHDPQQQALADAERPRRQQDFTFRGGCTLVFDIDDLIRKKRQRLLPRYCIRKDILSDARLRRQSAFLRGAEAGSLSATYFGAGRRLVSHGRAEPFALLHRGA